MKFSGSLSLLCACLFFLLLQNGLQPGPVWAEVLILSEKVQPVKQHLPPLVVKATRINPAPEEVPASFETIPGSTFDSRGAWYPGSELQGVPGFTVHNTNSGTNPSVVLRGIPNRIFNDSFLVMVDGVPYLTTNDEVDFDQIPFVAVDRVEVLRGTSTTLYGRGAVSGAVNYITHQPGFEPELEASLTFGSYSFRRLRLQADLPVKRDCDHLAISFLSESKAGWRPHTRRQRNSLVLRNDLKLSEKAEFSLSFSGLSLTQGLASELPVDRQGERIPMPSGSRDNYTVDDAEYKVNNWGLTAQLAIKLSDLCISQSTLHLRHPRLETTNGFPLPYDTVTQTINWSGFYAEYDYWTAYLDQQFVINLNRNRFLAGFSYEETTGTTTEDWTGEFDFGDLFYTQRRSAVSGNWVNQESWISDRLLDAESDGRFAAIYCEWETRLNEEITLKLGGRYDYFKRTVEYQPTVNGFGPVPGETVRDDNDHLSSLFSLSWRVTPKMLTYLLYGEGYNPAFGPVWSFNSRNTRLEPEISRTYEIGIKSFWGANQELSFDLSAYLMQRRDLLVVVPGQGGGEQVNAGKQRSLGLEGRFFWQAEKVIPGGVLFGTMQLINSKWEDYNFYDHFRGHSYDFSDNRVAGVPNFAGTVGWEQHFSERHLKVRGEYQYQSDYWYDDLNTTKGASYGLVNLALTWQPPWWSRTTFQVVGTNLLNKDYWYFFSDPDGPLAATPGAPLELMVKMELSW